MDKMMGAFSTVGIVIEILSTENHLNSYLSYTEIMIVFIIQQVRSAAIALYTNQPYQIQQTL